MQNKDLSYLWDSKKPVTCLAIGIDPGTNTGLAAYSGKHNRLIDCSTIPGANTWKASEKILEYLQFAKEYNMPFFFKIEDARLRKKYTRGDAKRMGAGYVKAHSMIWESFCKHYQYPYLVVHPPKGLALWESNPARFEMDTKYNKRTSKHARCAAFLVYGQKTLPLNTITQR